MLRLAPSLAPPRPAAPGCPPQPACAHRHPPSAVTWTSNSRKVAPQSTARWNDLSVFSRKGAGMGVGDVGCHTLAPMLWEGWGSGDALGCLPAAAAQAGAMEAAHAPARSHTRGGRPAPALRRPAPAAPQTACLPSPARPPPAVNYEGGGRAHDDEAPGLAPPPGGSGSGKGSCRRSAPNRVTPCRAASDHDFRAGSRWGGRPARPDPEPRTPRRRPNNPLRPTRITSGSARARSGAPCSGAPHKGVAAGWGAFNAAASMALLPCPPEAPLGAGRGQGEAKSMRSLVTLVRGDSHNAAAGPAGAATRLLGRCRAATQNRTPGTPCTQT